MSRTTNNSTRRADKHGKSRRRPAVRRSVIAVSAAAVLGVTGMTVSAYGDGADGLPPKADRNKANAEILDPRCSVPPDADMNVNKQVHDVAVQRGVNDKVMLATFEAGWVESHMNNLDCGDRDSLGVFQQRPSAGWGTPEECMNVVHATNAFLDQAIPNDKENPNQTAGQLAQSVQRSAFPDRYDQSEGKARELINAAG
jgi:hypothetical protein